MYCQMDSLWNDVAEPARNTALFYNAVWISCGKPKHVAVADIKRRTRALYDKAVKELKRDEEKNRSEVMAQAIL